MKALYRKIAQIMKDRVVRRRLTRCISVIAAVVVFFTTYATILPAITLEKTASCGIEEHQHSDDCYEDELICGQEESEGHHHDDSCYTVEKELVCQEKEHQHSEENGCYDEEGNLICELPEHVHDDSCYEEVKTLTCDQEESEGHHHTDACYKKVLVCGKEAHTHSTECYTDEEDQAEDTAVETVPENAAESNSTETAPENYVPELDPVELETVLGNHTGFYYYHPEEGEELPESSTEITDWQELKDDTVLASGDLVRMYLPYAIPAGSLNATNPVVQYRLPENIHLTDKQIKAINKNKNGFYNDYKTSHDDADKYLGAEAIEGDRRPDEELNDNVQEYISAVVRVKESSRGDQDLIFTFVPYTIEKNQTVYDAEENTVSTGEMITGWFACDFTMEQIDWAEEEAEKTAEIIFVSEDRDRDIEEISQILTCAQQSADSATEVFESGTLTADGEGYTVTMDYTEDAQIPDNAKLSVREITAETDRDSYEEYLEQAQQHVAKPGEDKANVDKEATRFFDIEILVEDGNGNTSKIEPAAPVNVRIQMDDAVTERASAETQQDPTVLHFAEEGVETIDSTTVDTSEKESNSNAASETEKVEEIRFEAESFSVYGVVYTVDFEYEVNGKKYKFSLPGGGFVSLTDLVEALGMTDDANAAENTADNNEKDSDAAPLMLDGVEVSEATRKFVADVDSVKFSDSELVWIAKIEEEGINVWDIIETNHVYPIVSADVDWNKLEKSYSTVLETGDWVLLSLMPFDTDEKLTITMKNGDVYEIPVTDAQRKLGGVEPRGKMTLLSSSQPTNEEFALPKAEASKTLTPNEDGTYELTLSMEVPNLSAQNSTHANVVIIYDSSNSMHYDVPGNEWNRDDEHGTYALYEGKYYQLNSFGTDIRKIFSFIDEEGVTHSLGVDQKNNGIYCGPKYSPTRTRMDVAEECVRNLADTLLAKNTPSDPNAIEVGFVEFASDIMQVQQPTTTPATIHGWVDACHTWVKETQNAGDLRGGTNWDAALRIASGRPYEGHDVAVQFSDNDPKYIIFVSDGNPTARTTPDGLIDGDPQYSSAEFDDGTRIGASGLYGDITPGVFGTGISDIKNYNYDRAVDQANLIIGEDDTYLYAVGIFGDADKMSGLPNNGYFEGSDKDSITNAFNNIIGQISSRMGYTNLSITDGITSMTSSALVDGNPDDFKYKVTKLNENNEEVDITDQVWPDGIPDDKRAVYHDGAQEYESGYITWDLGTDDLLLPGGKYSVSFTVWPNQDAYDLVADLNNGIRTLDDLTPEEASQIRGTSAPYSLKTNTRAEVTYSTAKEEKVDGGEPNIIYGEPQGATLEEPDPMPLVDSKIRIQKEWEADLEHKQFVDMMADNPDYKAELTLVSKGADGTPEDYIKDIVIGAPEGDPVPTVWPEYEENTTNYRWRNISAGLMVSEENARETKILETLQQNPEKYPTCTYNDTTYYILESGHDCYFTEAPGSDYHFELEEKTWHPMVVNEEVKNVTFGPDNTIISMEDLETLSAKNLLKGGIRIYKEVYDQSDNKITNDTTPFSITVTMKNPDKSAYSIDASEGGYRIVYGPNNPNKKESEEDQEDIGVQYPYGRSDRVGITGGEFTATIYAGDYIQVANVNRGVTYEVTEPNVPQGYTLDSIVYAQEKHEMTSNTSHQVTVKNKSDNVPSAASIKLIKVNESGEKLTGARFKLTPVNNEGMPVAGGTVQEKDVDSEGPNKGQVEFTGLSQGNYLLEETEAPEGYVRPASAWFFHVDENGKSWIITSSQDATVQLISPVDGSDNTYTVTNEEQNNPDEPEMPAPDFEKHKRIDALRDGEENPDTSHTDEELTDLYRIYLDYTVNSLQDPNGVDLLFVIDHSGSMNNWEWNGNPNRAPAVESVLNGDNGIISEFLEMNPNNNKWAAVGFNGNDGTDYVRFSFLPPYYTDNGFRVPNAGRNDSEILSGQDYAWRTEKSDIHLPNQGANRLTDYTAGFWRAEQFLSQEDIRSDEKKKVIVFISDGIPTLHIPDLNGSLSNAGNARGSRYYPDGEGGCPTEALTEFGYFVNDMTGYGYTFGENAEFYAIGFGDSVLAGDAGQNLLKGMIEAAYGEAKNENFIPINDARSNYDPQEVLRTALSAIIGKAESYSNVSIQDKLSDDVALYGITSGVDVPENILELAGTKVTMKQPDPDSPNGTSEVVLYENGAITAAGEEILDSVVYDSANRTVITKFKDDYEAKLGVTYTVSFDVEVTDAAYQKFANADNSYGSVKGDKDTDYGTNVSSSGKSGFRSNDEAKVTFTHDGNDETETYEHPVIQIFNAPIKIVKVDQSGHALAGAKFNLYNSEYEAEKGPDDPANVARKLNETELISTINNDGTEAQIMVDKLKHGTYYLVETKEPDGYFKLGGPIKIEVKVNSTLGQDDIELNASINGEDFPPRYIHRPIKEGDVWVMDVVNENGAELPHTGGTGTRIYTILGTMLITLGAAMLLFRRRTR